jgi:OFA family oxalate/formate antiporter-like MFS transporter
MSAPAASPVSADPEEDSTGSSSLLAPFSASCVAEADELLCLAGDETVAIHPAAIGLPMEASNSPILFYGWVMLPLAMLVMIATFPGQTIGVTYFIPHLRKTLDLSQTQMSATYLLATLLASIPLTYLGTFTDRLGLKRSVLIAVVLMAATCVAASQVQSTFMLLVVFFLLRMIGPGSMSLLANNTLAMWFDRRLGMASGFLQVGMAGAVASFPVGVLLLIDAYGWRGAYVFLGAILLIVLLPLMLLFYRERPSDLGQWPDGIAPDSNKDQQISDIYVAGVDLSAAIRYRSYWILIIATTIWSLVGTGIVFHIEGLFHQIGYSQLDSARACTLLAVGMGCMQLAGGLLADRLAIRWLVAASMTGMGTSCAAMALASSALIPGRGLFVAACTYGMAQGLMTIVASTAWARYFGRAHLGKIRGTTITAAIAGSSLGPLAMGISIDTWGGFAPALWMFATLALLCGIAGLFSGGKPNFSDG